MTAPLLVSLLFYYAIVIVNRIVNACLIEIETSDKIMYILLLTCVGIAYVIGTYVSQYKLSFARHRRLITVVTVITPAVFIKLTTDLISFRGFDLQTTRFSWFSGIFFSLLVIVAYFKVLHEEPTDRGRILNKIVATLALFGVIGVSFVGLLELPSFYQVPFSSVANEDLIKLFGAVLLVILALRGNRNHIPVSTRFMGVYPGVYYAIISTGIVLFFLAWTGWFTYSGAFLHHPSYFLGPSSLANDPLFPLFSSFPSQYGFGSIGLARYISRYGHFDIVTSFFIISFIIIWGTIVFFAAIISYKSKSLLSTIAVSVLFGLYPALSGWLPGLVGSINSPSTTFLRFGPSLLAAVIFGRAINKPNIANVVFSVGTLVLSVLWSFESALFTIGAVSMAVLNGFFNVIILPQKQRRIMLLSFIKIIFGFLLLMGIIVLYIFDFSWQSFSEYALMYGVKGHVAMPITLTSGVWVISALLILFSYRIGSMRITQYKMMTSAVLGWVISCFLYYVGRSHPHTILHIMGNILPVILFTLILNPDFKERIRVGLPIVPLLTVGVFLVLISPAWLQHPQPELPDWQVTKKYMKADESNQKCGLLEKNSKVNLSTLVGQLPAQLFFPNTRHWLPISPRGMFGSLPIHRQMDYINSSPKRNGYLIFKTAEPFPSNLPGLADWLEENFTKDLCLVEGETSCCRWIVK
jgi:hypothetical protein